MTGRCLVHRPRRVPENALEEKSETKNRFVVFDLDVKIWIGRVPSVAEARPARCPLCGYPGVLEDGHCGLWGHGKRTRQLWGPPEHDHEPEIREVVVLRYVCQRPTCSAVITVGPRGLLPRRLYTAATIALALWLWSCALWSPPKVREHASPWKVVGPSAPGRWAQLERWARAGIRGELWAGIGGDPRWSVRACAVRVARMVADAAPQGEGAWRAFCGASFSMAIAA